MGAEIFLKLAVIGDPVAHSASPQFHRGFLDEAGAAEKLHRVVDDLVGRDEALIATTERVSPSLHRVPVGLGESDRAIRLGIGRLLDLCDEVLLSLFSLKYGELCLLFCDLLGCPCLRERTRL